ncbi:MAG: DUF4340 domain-containing protein [Anaerolineae bacterium]|nr:DUF4340 domain-containing protein [Thermoflexales bacterium]MDW8407881.1 DUF4340 domain-containing protein [Anaerolineae bacterium]
MNRRNLILTVALIAQVMLILLITTLRTPSATAGAGPLLGETKSADISRLTIQDREGKRIELSRQGEGWVLPQYDDFPAETNRVTPFLDKLTGIRTGRLIARTATSHDRLQVAANNYARRIELTLANNRTQVLFIGTSAGGSAVHVRVEGSDEVYLADGLTSFDAGVEASSWINTTYLQVPQEQVNALTLTNANGTFEFEKDASGAWTMKGLAGGETLDASKVTELVSRLSFLNMNRPLGKTAKPEYGMETPTAVVTVTLKQENASPKPIVLRIGAQDTTDNTYTISSSESPYYVRANSFTVESFVSRRRQDFLVAPPTPTPTVEATPAATRETGATPTITP